MNLKNIKQKIIDNYNKCLQEIKINLPSQSQLKFKALEEGTFYARDLVSEPGNVLHPDEYAKRIILLRKDGLKVKYMMKKN